MRLKLPSRQVALRVELPRWEGKLWWIEIDGRAAGPLNTDFVAARERAELVRKIGTARVEAAADEAEKLQVGDKAARTFTREWIGGVVYDTCVTAWRTNLLDADTEKPLTCDRDNFIALFEFGIAEINKAVLDFQIACIEAGKAVQADTEATIKN